MPTEDKLFSQSHTHTHTHAIHSSTTTASNISTTNLSFFKQLKLKIVSAGVGDYDVAAAKAALDDFIASSRDPPSVKMLTFQTCPFCVEARRYLEELDVPYVDKVIDRNDPLRLELGKEFGRTSMPAVFVNGKFIGGMNDGSPGLKNLDVEDLPR